MYSNFNILLANNKWGLFSVFYRPEANTYRLIQVKANEKMWNEVFREHANRHPCCNGDLEWDEEGEQQQGLCWIERAKCSRCPYVSQRYKLYSEVGEGKRGKKSAAPNLSIHTALSQTPVGYTSFRKMLLSTNTPAPSNSGLLKSANKVSKAITEENKVDMKRRRQNIIQVNKLRGETDTRSVSVEGDAAYNNPIYSGIGKTPFQAATQTTYIMAESITTNRDIIALSTNSKLCSTRSCSRTAHTCSRTLPMSASIGDEYSMAAACIQQINEDLNITSITTDPDSRASQAVQDLQQKTAEQFTDTRHLSENQRKCINKIKFSNHMIPGRTKDIREKLKRRFGNDLVKRCEAEFHGAQKQYPGNIIMLKKCLSHVKFAIVKCYHRNHTECRKHSFACTGGKIKNWHNSNTCNLPTDFKLNCTEEDINLLYQCIEFRLGPKTLGKTRLATNTQKVEATNRAIRRSLPKNVTYTRNFEGRAHAAIHSVNNGPGQSIYKLCKKIGTPIVPGSRVSKSLHAVQKTREQQRMYHKSEKAKSARCKKRQYVYKLYDETKANENYKKGKMCPKIKKLKCDHSYAKGSPKK